MNTWIYVNIGINCIEDIHDYFEHLNIAISNTIDADYFWTFQYLRMKNRKSQAAPVWRLEASLQSLCPCTSLSVQPDLELFSVFLFSVFLSVCIPVCLHFSPGAPARLQHRLCSGLLCPKSRSTGSSWSSSTGCDWNYCQ